MLHMAFYSGFVGSTAVRPAPATLRPRSRLRGRCVKPRTGLEACCTEAETSRGSTQEVLCKANNAARTWFQSGHCSTSFYDMRLNLCAQSDASLQIRQRLATCQGY